MDKSPGYGITDDVQTITYTAFNKIETVSQANDSYRIVYGLDDQRIKTIYSYDDTEKLTRYYFGSFEVEIDSTGLEKQTDYISSPVGLIALSQKQDGKRELFYVHTDHLGSIQAITDKEGQLVTEYAYTPWGGRIHLKGDMSFTNRGYTGHEHLEPLGLINMNGRVYDPTLARFLSPDPYVQAPDFTQSFNRYAYCLNNPFKYTDPSGEFFYLIPSISWSDGGGVNFSISAGIGFYGVASAGITVGYGVSNDNWSLTANASYMGAYIYGGYDSNAGWMAGLGWGFGGLLSQQNISANSSLTSVGINWSQRGGFSYNVFGMTISDGGIYFDPSVGVGVSAMWGSGAPIFSNSVSTIDMDKSCFPTEEDFQIWYSKQSDLLKKHGVTKVGYTNKFSESDKLRRESNGVLTYKTDGSHPSGLMRPYYKGLKTEYHIYMSPHETVNAFNITVNHELIHVYHHTKYGRNYDTGASEYVASSYTRFYVPNFRHHYAPGIYKLHDIPANLIPIKEAYLPIPP